MPLCRAYYSSIMLLGGGGGWHKNSYLQWIKKNIRMVWNKIFKNVIKKNSHWHSNRYPKLNWKKNNHTKLKCFVYTVYIIIHHCLSLLQAVGRPFLPPYWSLGFQLCRYGYNSLQNMKRAVERTRNASIPLVSTILCTGHPTSTPDGV